ncbi:isochorismate synthase [Lonsdalea quercina]|uniref:isochorismate synthase n=1 Tax=Lonsdalea quercina TaxID=71657 RepID=A0A1H3ZS30_9GAMM|nr:isochorismate synthase [Lonsdalea quercina]SEA26573.1 isochorismate synthase [Lonsdalea quercina]
MSTLSAKSSASDISDLRRDDMLFLSPTASLHARGCYATLTHPAEDGDDLNGAFQRQMRQLFEQAQRDGLDNPLLVGAIPFDKRQPVNLQIPTSYRWIKRDALAERPAAAYPRILRQRQIPEQETFMRMVSAGIDATKRGELNKIVLSRLLDIETEQPLDTLSLLLQLNQQNPWSYNFHLPLAQGCLVGASPELLLRKQGTTIASQPLAGSSRRSNDAGEDHRLQQALQSSVKDRYEHQLVIEEMQRTLLPRSRSLSLPQEPTLISTPVLWHLATHLRAEVIDPRENALSMACLLHPTPALCGTPYTSALDLIGELEPFDRQRFGGIVGWCDAQGNGEWAVTIRCGEVQDNRVRLFAGAGIVPDSQPLSEWQETGVKLSTMLRAFGLQQDREYAA